jgi:hypothetical protein
MNFRHQLSGKISTALMTMVAITSQSTRLVLFAVVVSLSVQGGAQAGIILGSNFDDDLFSIDASSGVANLIGNSGVNGNGKGLAFDPEKNALFAISTSLGDLYSVDQITGVWTLIGGGFGNLTFPGLAYNSLTKTLYGSAGTGQEFFSIDTTTGQLNSVGTTSARISGLAYDSKNDILFGAGDDNMLYSVDMTNGNLTTIGDLGISAFNVGLAFDYDLDILYLNSQTTESLYTVNVDTGLSSLVGLNGQDRIQGLTYVGSLSVPVPAPATLALFGLGLAGIGFGQRRRLKAP